MAGNIQMNPQLPTFREVVGDYPAVITPTTTAAPVHSGPYKWVTSWLIRVRSLGTATYVRVGDRTAQTHSLITVGQTYGLNGNPGEVFDLSKIYVVSDTADATIELTAAYLPMPMFGNIILAVDQR